MKVTKARLKQIIKEELAKVNEDVASDERLAELTKNLGYNLGGFPNVAAGIRDALAEKFPKAAEALYNAYQESQSHLDMVYSSYDD